MISFIKQVQSLHLELWEGPYYRKYWEGIDASTSQEGSLLADHIFAAKMLRDRAHENGYADVMNAPLTKIVKAIGRVMRMQTTVNSLKGEAE